MTKTKAKFPKQIYVARENEGTEDEFLLSSETPDGMEVCEETRIVAVYSLARTVKLINKTEVV